MPLEDEYFELYDKIRRIWGTKECRAFLLHLLNDSRDGKRKGFSPEVAKDIIVMLKTHDYSHPELIEEVLPFRIVDPAKFTPRPPPNENQVLKVIAKILAMLIALAVLFKLVKLI